MSLLELLSIVSLLVGDLAAVVAIWEFLAEMQQKRQQKKP